MDLLIDVLLDTLLDAVKILPFLFITYLLMEILEKHTKDKIGDVVQKAGHFGPFFGAVLGVIPQCGFSAAASNLYAGRVITVGTLIAIYLSTSDEMLPLMISNRVPASKILPIIVAKAIIGIIAGFVIDFTARKTRKIRHQKNDEDFRIEEMCKREHCHCEDEEEGSVFHSAIVHTLHILIYILVLTFALNLTVELIGQDNIKNLLTSIPIFAHLFAGIIGLIPNCAASIIITELYLNGMISAGTMMSGLLVGAGIGLLVLFRVNPEIKRNLHITAILYITGVFFGTLIDLIGIF
ncbi:putative manganese transporter [Butyrivibrio sp. NC3005]|uniref:putative manganese transporter n=1 Tax=Butyrivibrio sp. NC3005 TaxID=1280685 RepID=UPI000407B648|nr:putative manganese transporter [Butyrivibrio sp. NC3005]